mgnify:CR=1 FL=1|jgi:hypothetical protein
MEVPDIGGKLQKLRTKWSPDESGFKEVKTGARSRMQERNLLPESVELREAREGLIDFFVDVYCGPGELEALIIRISLDRRDYIDLTGSLPWRAATLRETMSAVVDYLIKTGKVKTSKCWDCLFKDYPGSEFLPGLRDKFMNYN